MEEAGEPANHKDSFNFYKWNSSALRTNSFHTLLSQHENYYLISKSGRFSCKSANLEAYKCQFCNFESDLKIAVYRHQSLAHGTTNCFNPEMKLRSYICSKCSFETFSLVVFVRHFCEDFQLDKSLKMKRFQSELCFYKSNLKYMLVQNLHGHTNPEISHQYEERSHKTKRKWHLKRYILGEYLKPNEIKWFECEQCSFKSKLKGNLKRHILTKHSKPSEIKWFKCAQCSHKTKSKWHLKRHTLMKHSKPSEIKWFECEQCSHKTKYKGSLKRHIFRHHTKHSGIK